jgi:2-polyprenyl-3-methyl-5-hydroxy-6-metoxy-1,4-benzoquinol methylase
MSDARFDSAQAQQYWREHYGRRAAVDQDLDPDGLNNVCHPGRPLWLNQYYARFQDIVFRRLLAHADADLAASSKRALDVGCGAGRWCRVLASHGYETTGVDLQEELIRRDRERLPGVRFVCGSMQDFSSEALFDLVTTVTVLQHNPPDEQDRMISNMRRLLPCGGQVLALENIADQGVHVFTGSIDGWTSRFEKGGFRRKRVHRYDFSPFLRAGRFVAVGVRRLLQAPVQLLGRGTPSGPPRDPGAPLKAHGTPLRRAARIARASALRVCVAADSVVESVLVEANAPLPTIHCGFQFEAI